MTDDPAARKGWDRGPPSGGQETPMKTIMGTSEAARLTGFSPRRIREMLADGVLGGVRGPRRKDPSDSRGTAQPGSD